MWLWTKIECGFNENHPAILASRDLREKRFTERLIAISLCFIYDNYRRDDGSEARAVAATGADMVNGRGLNIFNGL